jgi:cbb3-type cytochrome oxidase subunit 3
MGATQSANKGIVAFPDEIQDVLKILKTASQWMFGLFLTGACLDFAMIFLVPLALYSKLVSIPVAIFTFLAALVTTVAAVLGTAIFIIFRNAARAQTNLNLGAELGNEMYAFMWIAAAFSIFAFVIQLCLLCCCRSRRKSKKEWRKSHKEHPGQFDGSDKDKEDASIP